MSNRLPELTDADIKELYHVNYMGVACTTPSIYIRATYALAESRIEAVVREAEREGAYKALIGLADGLRSLGSIKTLDEKAIRDFAKYHYTPSPPVCELSDGSTVTPCGPCWMWTSPNKDSYRQETSIFARLTLKHTGVDFEKLKAFEASAAELEGK